MNYQVQGRTGKTAWGWIEFYGVYGKNRTWDAHEEEPLGVYVNSVWIMKDQNNIVELGWTTDGKSGVNYRRFFRVWHVNGVYHEDPWGSPAAGTDHTYKLYNYKSDKQWRYIVDGQQRGETIQTWFDSGLAGAMRERHNTCDSGWAHWWNLKRADWAAQFSAWQTLDEWDNDPYWHLNPISNTEFYVNSGN